MAKYYTPTKLSENIHETPEGFLICMDVPIARTGWMTYGEGETPLETGDDGKVEIYRSAEEVFRPETIASFEGKAVTVKHPSDFVTPKNWTYLAKGVLQNIRRGPKDDEGEESLLADLLITDEFTIQMVKAGLREVSCGYEAVYEQTGEGKGKQTNIVGNHLALVEQGRAGSTYAINDEKEGAFMTDNFLKKLKLKFGAKVIDEMMKDEDKKDDKAKDAGAYDELVKMVSDLGEKMKRIEGFVENDKAKDGEKDGEKKEEDKSKDEDKKDEGKKEDDKAKDDMDPSEDEGNEAESKINSRLESLEAAVAKLLEKMTGDEDEEDKSEDEDSDESEDEEGEEGEESQSKKTGDEASRAEILSPGIKVSKKQDLKVEALRAAYQTKDGKEVILSLTGGKQPAFDSPEKVSTLFIAASEVLKVKRGSGLGKTKDANFESVDHKNEPMTAEKMNEINAAMWARK